MGTLYVCATPIGNLGDVTDNLRQTLATCPVIAAESVQAARRLLTALKIPAPELFNFREDGAGRSAASLLQRLKNDESVCLISEAGTPGISDPAWQLVQAAREAQIPVRSIAGPSALTAALAVSGIQTTEFAFFGFLPHKSSARQQMLGRAKSLHMTAIFFESPHRLEDSLQDIEKTYGEQYSLVMIKELTKLHEQQQQGTAAEHLGHLAEVSPKGEYVLILPALPAEEQKVDWVRCRAQASELLQAGMSKRDAAKFLSRWAELQKSIAYQLVEECAQSEF